MEMLFVLIGFLICVYRSYQIDKEREKIDAEFYAKAASLGYTFNN